MSGDHNEVALTESQLSWYQSEASVVVTFLSRHLNAINLTAGQVRATFERNRVTIKQDDQDKVYHLELSEEIDANKSSFKPIGAKVELNLAKLAAKRWDCLLAKSTASKELSAPVKLAFERQKMLDKLIKDVEEEERKNGSVS